jgi:Helicase conserved C-terminal domain
VAFVDSLRALTDRELAHFFAVRTDLADGVSSFPSLAARAIGPGSLHHCLSSLDQHSREVLDAVAYFGEPSSAVDIASLAQEPGNAKQIEEQLNVLRVLGLVARHEITPKGARTWSVPEGVRKVLAAPFGLRPPIIKLLERFGVGELRTIALNIGIEPRVVGKMGYIADIVTALTTPGMIATVLERGDDGYESVLRGIHDDLNGVYSLDTRPWSRQAIPDSLSWLMSHALLAPLNSESVVIPREVALQLRGGAVLARFSSVPPSVVSRRGRDLATKRAGIVDLTPNEVLNAIASIGLEWSRSNPQPLRSGGLGVKEVRTLTKLLGVDEVSTARLLELGGAAGLFIADEYTERVGVTALFEQWLREPAIDRWMVLVRTWMELTRSLTLTESGKAEAPLQDRWYDAIDEVWRRARVVEAFVSADTSEPLDFTAVARRVWWFSPGRWGEVGDAFTSVTTLIEEASLLGLIQNGALTPMGRAALLGDVLALETASAKMFPAPVDVFTVSGDLSAIAPAELVAVVAGELAFIAETRSKGAASVYQFTESSIRRAMDQGRTAEELLAFLESHARPGVPQPLRYLIDDVARRYGSVRAGSATSYVHVQDVALLAELVRAKKTQKAKLRLIAPTVAVSPLPLAKVIAALRDAGYLPVEEGSDGLVIAREAKQVVERPSFLRPRRSQTALANNIWSIVMGQRADPDEHEHPPVPDRVIEAIARLRAATT